MKTFDEWLNERGMQNHDVEFHGGSACEGWSAAMEAANTWHPMDTAPKDGTRFRVWIMDEEDGIDDEFHAQWTNRLIFNNVGGWVVSGIGQISCGNKIMLGWQPVAGFKQP